MKQRLEYSRETTAKRIRILEKKYGLKTIELTKRIYSDPDNPLSKDAINSKYTCLTSKLNGPTPNDDKPHNFTIDDLTAIANAFDVTVDWLLGAGPDDPEQAAAGTRDTGKGPSLRQQAEFFYDLTRLLPSSGQQVAFETIEKKEYCILYNDSKGERPNKYTVLRFPSYHQPNEFDRTYGSVEFEIEWGEDNALYGSMEINRFLETLSRFSDLRDKGMITEEEFDTTILSRIAMLPDDPIEQIRPVSVPDPGVPGAGK